MAILDLHDLDLLADELNDAPAQTRLRKLGLVMQPSPALDRARQRAGEAIDRRWMYLYERAHQRYGRAVAAVRDRVCQGCHITLPTSVSPTAAGALTMCESCGRILYWG